MPRAGTPEAIYVSLVFPLADLRACLLPAALPLDQAFRKKDASAHLRRFGSGLYRLQAKNNGSAVPTALNAAETWFISARRFLRIPNAVVAPRLFSDGFLSARLEISVTAPLLGAEETVDTWLKRLLGQNAELRQSRAGKRSPTRRTVVLGSVASHFRDAYLAATTPMSVQRAARDNPEGQEAALLVEARRLLRLTEPMIIVLMPPSASRAAGLGLHQGVVRTGKNTFRMLALYPDAKQDSTLIALACRCFMRLHTEGRAIIELAYEWLDNATTFTPNRIIAAKLDAISDRLTDCSMLLSGSGGKTLPLLNELAEVIVHASEQLAVLLEQNFPNAGSAQRRLARQLAHAAVPGAQFNINLNGIISQQGGMSGGTVVQNVTRTEGRVTA